MNTIPWLLTGALLAAAGTAVAAGANLLGTHGAWEAYAYSDRSGKVCYAASLPEKMDGKRETFVTVTHRPAEKALSVVAITGGYAYKAGSGVEVDIDGKKFNLFTSGDGAWAKDADTDRQLVEAMKAGTRLQVTGTPAKGNPTTDLYSLSGFTAAFTEIGKACGVK